MTVVEPVVTDREDSTSPVTVDRTLADRTLADRPSGLARRHFSSADAHPYDSVEWGLRDILLTGRDGEEIFSQRGVEFPVSWSQNACQIVATKYFRGTPGAADREWSLRQVVDRITDTITAWGVEHGYYDADAALVHNHELKFLMVNQAMAFNSPVWFNIGVQGVPQQSSACFVLDVEDDLQSILGWFAEEGTIFQGGSGAGVNLSKVRSSKEHVRGGGLASGPVSFMRGADASAGTIRSGGKTRRAAKMVILDADHPDVEDFIWCKAVEERKARDLAAAGWEMGVNGADIISIQYQNANNSVRVTDEFMRAALCGGTWELTARTTGEVIATVPAADLLHQMAAAAWECADPGIQFDSTIEAWNTTPSVKLRGSNPCSEHVRADNSSCNLASLNLLWFFADDGRFAVDDFVAACETTFLAQDILICGSDYPTDKITATTRTFRDLGIGFSNLGALLMTMGLPYDSDAGRVMAASVTGLMTGAAYRLSAAMASRVGPFPAFAENRTGALRVMGQHRDAAAAVAETGLEAIDAVRAASLRVWDEVVAAAGAHGLRNAQASLLAPTGTISFALDCDTTGVEPAFGLVTYKSLVGGGMMTIVVGAVDGALARLGYGPAEREAICGYILENGSALGAPGLAAEHLPVFATAVGDNAIDYMGHLKMMAAVQPLLAGAISKTANVPADATVEDMEALFVAAWKMGIKCLAAYRDGSKFGQPLSTSKASADPVAGAGSDVDVDALVDAKVSEVVSEAVAEAVADALADARTGASPRRDRLPQRRRSTTTSFQVGEIEGYVTVGEYDDGRPGELFLKVSRQGSTLSGIMDGVAIAVSLGLQYGVPLEAFVAKFVGARFEPAGITNDADLRLATSLLDYVFRRMALDYLPRERREMFGILSTAERVSPTLPGIVEAVQPDIAPPPPPAPAKHTGDLCSSCGGPLVQSGACKACVACGQTTGCS